MAAKLAILAHTLRAFATKFYCLVSDHALNVATHKFLNTAHEQFCRACHIVSTSSCDTTYKQL